MKLSLEDIEVLNACARRAFDEVDRQLKSATPPIATDFGCTTGLGAPVFSFMTVQRSPEPVVLGLSVLQAVPRGLVIHADVVEEDSGYILLAEPVATLQRPTMTLLLEMAGGMTARLCRRALESDLLGLRPRLGDSRPV